jgi:hypothetical protein
MEINHIQFEQYNPTQCTSSQPHLYTAYFIINVYSLCCPLVSLFAGFPTLKCAVPHQGGVVCIMVVLVVEEDMALPADMGRV